MKTAQYPAVHHLDTLSEPYRGNSVVSSVGESSVIREQYCMCAPRTKLEKNLIITVLALAITLLLVIIALAIIIEEYDCDDCSTKRIIQRFLGIRRKNVQE